jgi:hypothetical protein
MFTFLLALLFLGQSFSNESLLAENTAEMPKQEVQYIPLTEEESQALKDSFSAEEQQSFQEFFQTLSHSLQSVTETEIFKKIQTMFESRNTSLNIVLQLIPTKIVKAEELTATTTNEEQTFTA